MRLTNDIETTSLVPSLFFKIFKSYDTVMRAFLEKFKSKIGQSNALMAFFFLRQKKREKITKYICQFELVVTPFIKNLLIDDTVINFLLKNLTVKKKIQRSLKKKAT